MHSAASSAHPLRQTSFPPEEAAGSNEFALRSPSVESDITGITGNQSAPTANGTGGKKRGRKSKNRNVSGSVRSGGGRGTDGGGGGTSKAGGAQQRAVSAGLDEEEEDDDDDQGADLTGPAGADGANEPDRDAERKNLAVLVDAFNPDQADRYEMYRRVKLKKEVVRKITNHIVSQSVPPGVTLSINGYTKTFIGSIIERAREVQEEWAAIEQQEKSRSQTRVEVDPTDFGQANLANKEVYATVEMPSAGGALDPARLVLGGTREAATAPPPPPPRLSMEEQNGEGGAEAEKRNLGPLLPDHLREALRRYKRDGEGGGTGLSGLSVGMGVQGAKANRLQGRRLFK